MWQENVSSNSIFNLSCPFTSPLPQRNPRQNRRGSIMRKKLKRKLEQERKEESSFNTFSSQKNVSKKQQMGMSEMEKLEARSKAAKARLNSSQPVRNNTSMQVLNTKKTSVAILNNSDIASIPKKDEKMEISGPILSNNDSCEIPIKKMKSCTIISPKTQLNHGLLKNSSEARSKAEKTTNTVSKRKIKLNRRSVLKGKT